MTSLLAFTPHFQHFSALGHAQFPRCRFRGSEVAELLPPTGYVAHHSKIELYYLPSDKELYGDDNDEDQNKQGDDEDSARESMSQGRRGDSVLGLELSTKGSPRSKGTASPSARKDRAGVSFEDLQSTDGEERGERKEPEPIDGTTAPDDRTNNRGVPT